MGRIDGHPGDPHGIGCDVVAASRTGSGEGRPAEMGGDALDRWLGEGAATLQALLRDSPDIVGVLDRDLIVRYINRTGPGLTREGVTGVSVLDVLPSEYREPARAEYEAVLRTGEPRRFEQIYADDDGVRMWEVRVGPIRHEGEVIGLIGTTTEVTDQRRESADRDRFFALSLDMLVVVSSDGVFKRVNPAFGKALGYDTDELVGARFLDLVHPDDRARTREGFMGVVEGTPVTDFENRYRRNNGEHRVFSWRATSDPVTGDVYAVARDVTDHRAVEIQLRQAQKMEAVGQLAGGVAHDFNNLLLAILANAELAQMSVAPDSQVADHLVEIDNAAQRAADLTKQLLVFSRRQPLRPVPVDLNDLVAGLMKMLRRLLPESIAIDFIPGHALATVSADPGQLEQVVVNLCVNARDAMAQGGRLTIETENVLINGRYRETHPWAQPGRYVLLTVTDTGTGMSTEVRERIFEPFFTTKPMHQGTGLGLSTVYGIVRQHDGMVQLYSEPGDGTTFKIYLPASSRRAEHVGSKIEPSPPRGRETILLAEDDDLVRRAVVGILEGAGYRVVAVAHGLEAVRWLRDENESVDLALLDVVMPVLGGPDTWQQLRDLRPDLRVLFSSGYADGRYRGRLPEDADIVEKPYRAEELLRKVRETLDG